eukprot:CAMPEP_0174378284 /NCGR_PEP_ID=MMETSP0811_2-20130205/121954_1 /TAXON_ID=73025 ORGANISM="Eutreptiella gymnastica-like, Strain CCMP1594" /NCGR_SAMPLE_ID=MMETSP0811_2 /ASSEMBLY_ACC=CAM_ASM_000667 /LENGTH=143 /DNA_ID=CAMNT_0015530459 /DNA_START=1499 /DNA_END=1930 /DNA_ORIENTATION=-
MQPSGGALQPLGRCGAWLGRCLKPPSAMHASSSCDLQRCLCHYNCAILCDVVSLAVPPSSWRCTSSCRRPPAPVQALRGLHTADIAGDEHPLPSRPWVWVVVPVRHAMAGGSGGDVISVTLPLGPNDLMSEQPATLVSVNFAG